MSNSAENYNRLFSQRSAVFLLPDELLMEVFQHLPTHDLRLVVPLVCARWRRVSSDRDLWRDRYAREYSGIPKSLAEKLEQSKKTCTAHVKPIDTAVEARQDVNEFVDISDSGSDSSQATAPFEMDGAAAIGPHVSRVYLDAMERHTPYGRQQQHFLAKTPYLLDVEELLGSGGGSSSGLAKGPELEGWSEESGDEDEYFAEDESFGAPQRSKDEERAADDDGVDWREEFCQRALDNAAWRAFRCRPRAALRAHATPVASVAAAGTQMVSGSLDGRVCLWAGQTLVDSIGAHGDWINAVVPLSSAADGGAVENVLSCSYDRTLQLWHVGRAGAAALTALRGHENIVWECAALSPTVVASVSSDGTLRTWDLARAEERKVRRVADGLPLYALAAAADGRSVVTGSQSGEVGLWDVRERGSGYAFGLAGHDDGVLCVGYDADSHVVVSGSRDTTLRVWDVRTRQCLRTLRGHHGRVFSLQFDHGKVVSGSDDNTVRVWSREADGDPLMASLTLDSWVNDLYFRGRELCVACENRILLWDVCAVDLTPSFTELGPAEAAATLGDLTAVRTAAAMAYDAPPPLPPQRKRQIVSPSSSPPTSDLPAIQEARCNIQ